MFRFFPDEKDNEENKGERQREALDPVLALGPFGFEQVQPSQLHYDLGTRIGTNQQRNIKFLRVQELIRSTSTVIKEEVKQTLESSSDLQSGKYEGGFKLWECTLDLLDYLEEERGGVMENKRVLDLGCGHGLLGIYALKKGAKSIMFQDYNRDVLDFLTIPNVVANLGDEGLARSTFFSGSWRAFRDKVEKDVNEECKFDVILSSETIYNTEYLDDFIVLVDRCLTPDGTLYLAAKTCYFGVGGGTKTFVTLAQKRNMHVSTAKVIKNGVQREVLEVKQKR